MTKKIKENKISQISDVEHVILRSGIYIGSTEPVHASTFFYNEKSGMFEYKEFDYIPAFCKIINEIIDNSLDEAIRTNFKFGNEIQVTIDDSTVTVKDNGRGVPTDIDPATGISQLELAFTRARAGSNFDDSDRSTIGQNGVGSFCTNCFSKSFIVKSVTKKQKGTLTCTDNVSSTKCRITDNDNGKETGTIVEFVPDLKKFKMKKIDATHINIIYQRLLFLSVSYPEISFKFNKKLIRFKTNKAFLNHFDEHNTFVAGENYLIGVIPNTFDDFISKSFVNGADCINGGNHIDYIHSEVVGRLKEKLERKYPSIKPGDIKNKLTYIITFRDFNNAKFDSQTKEKLANNVNDVKEYLKDVDWDKLATGIYKNEAIMNPIIESFKIKEELKNRQSLNKISKTKGTFKCEKFFPATEENKYIFISEGDSAAGGLISCLSRKQIGFFATKGVPLNAYEASVAKLTENEELTNLIKILNLKLNNEKQELNYENIVIASDQDSDGMHINGLYIGFFMKYCPVIIKQGLLKRFCTPVVVFKDKSGNIKHFFFSIDEYNQFIKKHDVKGLNIHYYKGLGSWEREDLLPLVEKYGLDYFVRTIEYDNTTEKIVDDWLNGKNAEVRRNYLKKNEFSIFGI